MKPNIDFGLPDILGGAADDEILTDLPGDTEEASDVPCPVTKFFQTAQLAATTNLGRSAHQHVHNFAVELAPLDAAVAAHYKKLAFAVTKKKPAPAAAGGDDPHALEKAFSPEGRRKANLREFLKGRLAEGDTAEAVIAHAARYDAHTANLLREIAMEFA